MRYFFDYVIGGEKSLDTDGTELADVQVAWYEAARALFELAQDLLRYDGELRDLSICVRDNAGRLQFERHLYLVSGLPAGQSASDPLAVPAARQDAQLGNGPLEAAPPLLDSAGLGIMITDARLDRPGPTILYANRGLERLTGYRARELVGQTPRIFHGRRTDREVMDRLNHDLGAEREFVGETYNYRKDGTEYLVEWRISPIAEGGRVTAWLAVLQDVTEGRDNAVRLRDATLELQHRTSNLLAVISAIAAKSMPLAADMQSYRAGLDRRIASLARSHRHLSLLKGNERVTFDSLLLGELTAYSAQDRAATEGPRGVRLSSRAVQPLGMVLHELTDNACRHGALLMGGDLEVNWSLVADDARLRIEWFETGLKVAQRQQKGMGRLVIEQLLPQELDAHTEFQIAPHSLRCLIELPVSVKHH